MNDRVKSDVAMIGLGVMGANLARNLARQQRRVIGFDRDVAAASRVAAVHPEFQHADTALAIANDWQELIDGLERPRRIVVLVPSGDPVDQVLNALDPLLEADDVVVDAGNSRYAETEARIVRLAGRPWRFVGMGVSGGAEGALNGPALMPGGDRNAWTYLRPMLEEIAAESPHGPCVAYCGRSSAGHFVKMVHNGIEYGDMQLIAESATLLRTGLGMPATEVADTFSTWNEGELDSYLIEITADIFRMRDPEGDGETLLVDAILDQAGQKGTGAWTAQAALELGVSVPTIAAAVDARTASAHKALRVEAGRRFGPTPRPLEGVGAGEIEQALFASKLACYSQGFSLLQAASEQFDYGIELGEVARVWTAGCIIRARLLERVMQALREQPPPSLLAFAFQRELTERLPAWRRVVAAAFSAGLPVPGLAASLSWFDTLVTAHGSAGVLQAQRDLFGSHTYERIDRPGVKVHTDWNSSS